MSGLLSIVVLVTVVALLMLGAVLALSQLFKGLIFLAQQLHGFLFGNDVQESNHRPIVPASLARKVPTEAPAILSNDDFRAAMRNELLRARDQRWMTDLVYRLVIQALEQSWAESSVEPISPSVPFDRPDIMASAASPPDTSQATGDWAPLEAVSQLAPTHTERTSDLAESVTPTPEELTEPHIVVAEEVEDAGAHPTPSLLAIHESVIERAQRFAERQAESRHLDTADSTHMSRSSTSPLPSTPPSPSSSQSSSPPPSPFSNTRTTKTREPSVPWTQWLAGFLEERNIRWGELVGGLLIVSCSVALVISFWTAISERPLLKFGLLNGVTASLVAVGLYAAHRWKLPTTSQGILLTSVLLVPVNFLAIAAFTRQSDTMSSIAIGGELFSLILFTGLVYAASRVVTPRWAASNAAGVVLPSASQLLTARVVDGHIAILPLSLLIAINLITYAACQLSGLRSILDGESTDESTDNQIFKRLGLSSYATFMSLGLLIFQLKPVTLWLPGFAPWTGLLAVPSLLWGVVAWKKPGSSVATHRVVGVALVAVSAVIMLGGWSLAWPQPIWLMFCGTLCALVLSSLGIWLKLPELHLITAVVATSTVVLLANVVTGQLPWKVESDALVIQAIWSALTARTLAAAAGTILILAATLCHPRVIRLRRAYEILSGIIASLALAMAMWFGFGVTGDPEHVSLMCLAYAAVIVWLGVKRQHEISVSCAMALLWLGFWQALVHGFLRGSWSIPLAMVCQLHATLLSMVWVYLEYRKADTRVAILRPTQAAIMMNGLAIVLALILNGSPNNLWTVAAHLLGMAGLFFMSAWLGRWRWSWNVASLSLAGSLSVAVYAVVSDRVESPNVLWHPHHAQWQATGWALLALTGFLLRRGIGNAVDASEEIGKHRQARLIQLVRPNDWGLAHGLLLSSLLVFLLLAIYSVVPGVCQELSLRATRERMVPDARHFEIAGIPHAAARSWVLVCLATTLAAAALAGMRREGVRFSGTVLRLIAWALPLLIAASFASQVAVASALRWGMAIYFLLASMVHWWAAPFLQRIVGCKPQTGAKARSWAWRSFWELLTLAILPVVAMVTLVGHNATTWTAPADRVVNGFAQTSLVLSVLGASLWAVTRYRSGRSDHVDWKPASGLVIGAVVLPSFVMTVFGVAKVLVLHPIVGAEANSWFRQAGLVVSYVVPMALMSMALVGNAASLKSRALAFFAAQFLAISAVAAYLLSLRVGSLELLHWMRLGQLQAAVLSLFSIAWPSVVRRVHSDAVSPHDRDSSHPDLWHQTLLLMSAGWAYLPLVAITLGVWIDPRQNWPVAVAGDLGSLIAWGCVASALGWVWFRPVFNARRKLPMLAIVGTVVWIAASQLPRAMGWTNGNHWWTYHLLHVCAMAFCLLRAPTPLVRTRRFAGDGGTIHTDLLASHSRQERAWSHLLIAIVIGFSLRGILSDPLAPYGSVAGFLVAAVACTLHGWYRRTDTYWAFASTLIMMGANDWWFYVGHRWFGNSAGSKLFTWIEFNAAVAGLLVPIWVFLSRTGKRATTPRDETERSHETETFAARDIGIQLVSSSWINWILLADLLGLTVSVFANLERYGWGRGLADDLRLRWMAVITVWIASVSIYWSTSGRFAGFACYWSGLLSVGVLLGQTSDGATSLSWPACMLLAAYGVLSSYIWSRRDGWHSLLAQFGALTPDRSERTSQVWIVPANLLLAFAVIVLGFWSQGMKSDWAQRMSASQAILSQAIALGLLARGQRAGQLRYAALVVSVLGAIAFGFSWLTVHTPVLDRMVIALVAVASMAVAFDFGWIRFLRRANEWTEAAERLVPALLAVAAAIVAGIIGVETFQSWNGQSVPISSISIGLVAAVLLGLSSASVAAACVPGRDPLGWNEREKERYIYAAELLTAVLVWHLRLTIPHWFDGFLARYWTLVTVGLAYLGVGLSEYFRRTKQRVLIEPLQRTGILLAVVPLISIWLGPIHHVHPSLLILIGGGVYAVLATTRQSLIMGSLAALLANVACWYFWHHDAALFIWSHPQIWLVPPAVCLLVAGHWQREQLTRSQMTTVRYLGASIIYASSSAEIFLQGVSDAPWLPFVLAGFSLAGIFAGIWLRTRAFLFLGFAFLNVSLLSVIWHAAVDLHQTWLWYVTGIVVGVLILVLFAFFERKRQEVLQIMERLKQWES